MNDGIPPPTPDYPDEITEEQIARIQKVVDENKPADFRLVPLHPPAW